MEGPNAVQSQWHPLGMACHSEWLRNNPQRPHWPNPPPQRPKAHKALVPTCPLSQPQRALGPATPKSPFPQGDARSASKLPIKIHIRLRACRRPSIFSPAESAPPPNVRDALFSLLQGADPLDPKAPQGPHPHPNPPRDPRGPKGPGGRGPRGTQGTLWGYSEAIPNGMPFRVDGYYEMKAVAKIIHSEMEATAFISNPL